MCVLILHGDRSRDVEIRRVPRVRVSCVSRAAPAILSCLSSPCAGGGGGAACRPILNRGGERRGREQRACVRERASVWETVVGCVGVVCVVLEVESVAAAVGIDTVGLLYGLCLWGCMLPMLARVLTVLTDA